jgi:hypothetical protein
MIEAEIRKEELEKRRALARKILKGLLKLAQACTEEMGESWILSEVKESNPELFEGD